MGIDWYVHVAMNRVTVKAPGAVRSILQEYDIQPLLDVVLHSDLESGTLVLDEDEFDFNGWPSAVRVDELPKEGDDEVTGDWFNAVYELHQAKGEKGLDELLLKLAPYLTEPLVLQAADFSDGGDFSMAEEWTIRPHATVVECREIVGFANGNNPGALAATTDDLQQTKPSFADAAYALLPMLTQRSRETIH